MGAVVQLRTRRQRPTVAVSPEFEAAWAAFPETGRLRSSKRQSWPEWVSVAGEIGEDDLLARVERYAREDKDHRREHGAPGFHRWLKWGRWEHWAPLPSATVTALKTTFPDPELRASFAERFSSEALKWFDRCGWDEEAREIISYRRNLKSEWLQGPFNRWAKANGVKALVFA